MRLKKLSIFLSIPALALSLASCGNSSEKPTKDEAKAGMAKILKQLPDFKRANVPESVVKSLSSCVVDKIYDKAKPETLMGLADGNKSATVSSSDKTLIQGASLQCTTEVRRQMGAGTGNK